MMPAYDTVVVRTVAKIMIPMIQVFALYVVFHGAKSPGGGFQGGAILGASVILARLTAGPGISVGYLPVLSGLPGGAAGVLIYATVGALPLLWGGAFLDYGAVPMAGIHAAELRALGIEAVEVGVALAVACVMVSIFDDLAPNRRPTRAATSRRTATSTHD